MGSLFPGETGQGQLMNQAAPNRLSSTGMSNTCESDSATSKLDLSQQLNSYGVVSSVTKNYPVFHNFYDSSQAVTFRAHAVHNSGYPVEYLNAALESHANSSVQSYCIATVNQYLELNESFLFFWAFVALSWPFGENIRRFSAFTGNKEDSLCV